MGTSRVNRCFSSVLKKNWTKEAIQKYVGAYRRCFFSYARDPSLRENAASGGSITAILADLLDRRAIRGAVVCRSVVNAEGFLRPEFFMATDLEALKGAQGSQYSAVHFGRQALPLIRSFEGKVAVVALPCDIKMLRVAMGNDPNLKDKVLVMISLFCGHNSEPVLTDRIIDRLRPGQKRLTAFRYRTGHWRGQLKATFEGGEIATRPFSCFSDYQNLFFCAQRKCHHCFDHTGYHADVSAGDIWSLRMKDNPIKHTALITRSEIGDDVVAAAFTSGYLLGQEEPIEEVCDGQARSLPTHYHVTARAKLGWIAHEKINDEVHGRVKFRQYIVAALNLFNERVSRSKAGKRIIFALPRPVLKAYLYFIKLLESL
jgi:coenzyme F420-reducing hydrogenase beta subunit